MISTVAALDQSQILGNLVVPLSNLVVPHSNLVVPLATISKQVYSMHGNTNTGIVLCGGFFHPSKQYDTNVHVHVPGLVPKMHRPVI